MHYTKFTHKLTVQIHHEQTKQINSARIVICLCYNMTKKSLIILIPQYIIIFFSNFSINIYYVAIYGSRKTGKKQIS